MRRSLSLAVLLLAASAAFGVARADEVRRFVVYFGSWSARIDTPARKVVAAAAAAARRDTAATVSVTGYASTIGSVEANTLLSQLRAQIVSDELAGDGVDANRIVRTATGATVFMVQPVEARRVVIEVGKN